MIRWGLLLELSVTVSVEASCPFTPGAKWTAMWQCPPRATLTPMLQVVLVESTAKLLTLKLRRPITSADLLRHGLPIVIIRAPLTVPTLCRLNEIVFGVNVAGPVLGVGVGVGVGVGIGVGTGVGV